MYFYVFCPSVGSAVLRRLTRLTTPETFLVYVQVVHPHIGRCGTKGVFTLRLCKNVSNTSTPIYEIILLILSLVVHGVGASYHGRNFLEDLSLRWGRRGVGGVADQGCRMGLIARMHYLGELAAVQGGSNGNFYRFITTKYNIM